MCILLFFMVWCSLYMYMYVCLLESTVFFKTDSGYLKDEEAILFNLANHGNFLCCNTYWSAPPVSCLARSKGPRTNKNSGATDPPRPSRQLFYPFDWATRDLKSFWSHGMSMSRFGHQKIEFALSHRFAGFVVEGHQDGREGSVPYHHVK